MKRPCDRTCHWISLACAAGVILICGLVLALWQLDSPAMLDLTPGLPVMAPNSAVVLGIAGFCLAALSVGRNTWTRTLPYPVGAILLVVGSCAIFERITGIRTWINHAYADALSARGHAFAHQMTSPSPVAGLAFVLLGAAFLTWRSRYRAAQGFLFGTLAVAGCALLGQFYEIQTLYRLPGDPLQAGLSLHTASGLVLLCAGLFFTRPEESVVRMAFSENPSGAMVLRFGLGGLVTLAVFGLTTLLKVFVDASYFPLLRGALSLALLVGLVSVIWSTVRALDRIETARRRAVADLERSREQLLFAQRLAKVAYWQWNLLTDEIVASDELFRLFDSFRPIDRLTFTGLLGMVHPEDRRRLTDTAYSSIAGRSFFSADYRIVRQNGAVVYVHSQARVELDEKGLPCRLRGASLDVTDIKRAEIGARQAEERIRILLDKANEAVRVREDVLSIVSHDLKNPLTSASLGVQLLLRQLGDKPETSPLVRTANNVQRSLENMKSLIQGILDVGKIQSGTFAIDVAPVCPAKLLSGIGEVMQPIARDRGIELKIDPPPSTMALGDAGRLQQVLLNLVGNALKFTERGGKVRVTCERDAGRLVFLVEDNGPGIPAQNLRQIFERNWQAPATATCGNGLGLFIAKGIVEAHRGHIWAESEVGHGSRFRFTVPEANSERVLDGKSADGVEPTLVDFGVRGVHVPETVAVAPLQLEREVLREVDIHPQAGHA
jgi:signal transduction histidine kinase